MLKKILMLSHDKYLDRRIVNEANSLVSFGYDVEVVSLYSHNNNYKFTHIPIFTEKRSFSYRLKCLLLIEKLLSKLPCYYSIRGFVGHFFVNFENHFYNMVWPVIHEKQADIVVSHDLPMLYSARVFAAQKKCKLVYDSHELYTEQEYSLYEKSAWKKIEKENIAFCDLIITVNQSIANILQDRYNLKQVAVITNAYQASDQSIDFDSKLLHKNLSLDSNVKILLYQGGLIDNRNLDAMIDVLLYLPEHFHIVYMGEGNYQFKLVSKANKMKLSNRVHFHQKVTQSVLLKYTASADVGFIPYLPTSINTRYCSPNKLYEYIAAGLPVISHDLIEVKKILLTNNFGKVVDFQDVQCVAKTLLTLIENHSMYQGIKEAISAKKQKYCWFHEENKLKSLFRELL